ncbi:hypothetical protein NE865_09473 [Phthorimaea operculella]|nr:hypothetical protein NE865_09473 [Phthorimaea operculella]
MSMQSLRSATVVITAMNALKNVEELKFIEIHKSEKASIFYRSEGNKFYAAKKFRSALECYNRSLMYAPKNSHAMKLAYSNRSALLFTVEAYTASFSDIVTVFSMGLTDKKLIQRLQVRKLECLRLAWKDNLLFGDEWERNLFKFDVKRNAQIPCASKNVDVVTESGFPKIVAARNTPVGTIVAIEQPFVNALHEGNNYISCHYCHKLSLNLVPCDECCEVLFCDEECKKNAKYEYHNIECKVSHKFVSGPESKMGLKAALKMRKKCKSWKELVDASTNIGADRMRSSSVRDIYDVNSKFSLLCYNFTDVYVHGQIFTQSFVYGTILNELANVPDFFPKKSEEKDAAMRAFARIMMHLFTSYRKIEVPSVAKDFATGILTAHIQLNFGFFSFASKLKHDCNANLVVLGLNNNIALMAIRPVKTGDELTISFLGHYYDNIPTTRAFRLFRVIQDVCKCCICVDKWSSSNLRTLEETLQVLDSDILLDIERSRGMDKCFQLVCEGLTLLDHAHCTEAHWEFLKYFLKLTTFCIYLATKNNFIQKFGGDDVDLYKRLVEIK